VSHSNPTISKLPSTSPVTITPGSGAVIGLADGEDGPTPADQETPIVSVKASCSVAETARSTRSVIAARSRP
jgi:hypothetical protein